MVTSVFAARLVEVRPGITLFTASTEGPPDRSLLVIHGGPDWDHSYLREPLSGLSGHRVVMPDLRGCGQSTSGLADDQYTPDAVVDDLVKLLDVLDLSQVSVLGFSYGGLIAQRLAVTIPDRVRRLVIASSSVLPFDDTAFGEWPERQRRRAAEAAVWADSSLLGADLTRMVAIASAPANIWREDALPDYLRRLHQVRFTAEWMRPWLTGCLPSPRIDEPIEHLGPTDIPIMLLHGRQDMIFPAAVVEQAAAMLPNAEHVILDQAGHMTHVDQPRQWLDAVTGFIR